MTEILVGKQRILLRTLLLIVVMQAIAHQAWGSDEEVAGEFTNHIQPLLKRYCQDCHGGESPEAKLDMSHFRTVSDVTSTWGLWKDVTSRIHELEMPPADASPQPSQQERELIEGWTKRFRKSEAERLQGDPGIVGTRRLSNAEYNNVIRSLTGVDIRPTRNFPVDPANEAGFDNSAESLTISPALVVKYLDAAREVADHLLLVPDGIRFAPHPVVTDTDRDKYSVQRIVDFYLRQPTSIDHYLLAAWKLSTVQDSQVDGESIERISQQYRISSKYFETILGSLRDKNRSYGPMQKIRDRFQEMVREVSDEKVAKERCQAIDAYIREERAKLKPKLESLKGPGMNGGSQPLVLWKNRQMAEHRMSSAVDAESLASDSSLLQEEDRSLYEQGSDEVRKGIIEAYQHFCSIFPDAFYISERGRAHIEEKEAAKEGKGRLLSAGFHSMMGYFRDDLPLRKLLLNDEENRELDQLWEELDFISLAPIRQYSGFIWFERAESSFINEEAFHFVRAEDKSANSDAMIDRFAAAYLEKLHRKEAAPRVIEAVDFHFRDMKRQIRSLEAKLLQAETRQREALIHFAAQAFRRPLTTEEQSTIESFYHRARELPNADHRSAMEDTLSSILISPSLLFRWDLQSQSSTIQPLTSVEMASRLSFFLWASNPDRVLSTTAEKEDLNREAQLTEQLNRMLLDSRSKGMLTEFLGNWLDFRRFDMHQGVDRTQFPTFDDRLRASMSREPIEFVHDLLVRDGSLRELLMCDHVVVDRGLAQHYGIEWDANDGDIWKRIDNVGSLQRGGLVPMGVFLTQNSPGLRTSPVKRGYWLVRKLLGESIPPPPPAVPELPASEKDLGDKTLRELLEKHRENPSCAACHRRFDAAGLLLEGFDPIGKPRTIDLGGRSIADDATLPNGLEAKGLPGLRDYLLRFRYDDFRRHFCESLAAYALGRTLVVADDILVDSMINQMKQNDDRVRVAFQVIVLSKPFRNKRGESNLDR